MRVHIFPKGTSPKMNIIVQLEFKLVYLKPTVQHFSHSPHKDDGIKKKKKKKKNQF